MTRAWPSGRSASADASRTALTLRVVERRGVAAARVVEVGPAAGHPGPEVGADRAEDDDRPAGHVFAAVRADPLDDGLGAAVADREAHPARPTRWSRPPVAPYRTVLPAIASDAASAARSGSGATVMRPARQALADVVVGLADEPELDAGTGERTERLAGRAAQVEPDRAVELAALERAGQPGPERAVGRRQPQTGRGDRALAAERGGDADLERRRRGAPDVAAGGGRVRAAGRVRRATARRR